MRFQVDKITGKRDVECIVRRGTTEADTDKRPVPMAVFEELGFALKAWETKDESREPEPEEMLVGCG